ncbi:MAG: pilus assembly protein PilM [Bdellovibrionia bacterium]
MRILGIDFGSSSIKSVEMDSAFGRFDIRDYHEQTIRPEETQLDALNRLIRGLPKPPDKVIIALPTSQNTFRNLLLPTKDKKAIQSAIGFELEDDLPFSLEDASFQSVILAQGKQGSNIHVTITLKRHIVALIQKWQETEINPDVITTEEWAYRAILNRMLGTSASTGEDPILLAIVGHERTIFYLHRMGTPALIRETRWGGKDLTQAIASKYQIPLDQAETNKLDHAIIFHSKRPTDATAEQLEMSACLEGPCEALLTELRQIDLVARNVTQRGITLIYLSGGTALLPGLGHWLEDKLQVPVKPLLALSTITTSGITYSEQTDARFLLAASLPLTMVGNDRNQIINFRKDTFSKTSRSRELDLRAFKKPLMAVATVAVSLVLSLAVQSAVYKTRMTSTNTQLEKAIRTFFGQVSSSSLRSYMSNTSALRASINKELGKQRELNRLLGPNTRSPLDFLNSLSSNISRGLVVDLTEFKAGIPNTDSFLANDHPSEASLAFLVSNPQVAEKLTILLKSKLSSFERGKMEETAALEGSPQKWKISFSGKPTEDSYGR